jgi:hypothetical protein
LPQSGAHRAGPSREGGLWIKTSALLIGGHFFFLTSPP